MKQETEKQDRKSKTGGREMTELMQEAISKIRIMGFQPSVASWEDNEHVYAFSIETLGPNTYNHPRATVHYFKPMQRWS